MQPKYPRPADQRTEMLIDIAIASACGFLLAVVAVLYM